MFLCVHVYLCVQLLHKEASTLDLELSRPKPVFHGSVFNLKMMMGKFVDQSNPELSNPGKSPVSCAHYSSWLHTRLPQKLLLRKYDVTSLS